MQPTNFDLAQLLAGIVEVARGRAQDKRLAFHAEWVSELPAVVCTDERRLRQVLMNLLDNAVKYTTDGRVVFRVGRQEGRVRFLVEDTGIGIDSTHLPRIF